MKKIVFIIIASFLLSSCVSIKNSEKVPAYENDLKSRFVPYNNCFAVLPFTLNYTKQGCYPIIKINNSFFLLDTGADSTLLSDRGLKDLFFENYENIMNKKELLKDDGNIHIFTDPVGSWIIPAYNGDQKKIPFYYTNFDFESYEGIIGESTFREFSNIIIDYKNKLIIFDGEPISEEEIPMIVDDEGLCFIEFTCKGIKEIGLIDTGAHAFLLRSTFFEKPYEFNFLSEQKIDELKKREVKLTKPKKYLFKDIKIGKTNFNKINGFLSSDSSILMTDEARGRTTEYSILGFPFFKDKIIQLDYKNKVFRIK